jgi:molybdopterin converting factor small subunit
MKIIVKLFATLARFSKGGLPGTPFEFDLAEGGTLSILVNALGLPEDEVKLCFVNGRVEETDYLLKASDDVGIFPPVGGG